MSDFLPKKYCIKFVLKLLTIFRKKIRNQKHQYKSCIHYNHLRFLLLHFGL